MPLDPDLTPALTQEEFDALWEDDDPEQFCAEEGWVYHIIPADLDYTLEDVTAYTVGAK